MIGGAIQVMELTANIHLEEGSYWAQVSEMPGCFATGFTLDELISSLREEIQLYLAENESDLEKPVPPLQIRSAVLTDATPA